MILYRLFDKHRPSYSQDQTRYTKHELIKFLDGLAAAYAKQYNGSSMKIQRVTEKNLESWAKRLDYEIIEDEFIINTNYKIAA